MKKARIAVALFIVLPIALSLFYEVYMKTEIYYPEFGQSLSRREAQARYDAFNRRVKSSDQEEENEPSYEQIVAARDSVMNTKPKDFSIDISNLSEANWGNVYFSDGAYFNSDSSLFTGKLLDFYESGSPRLEAYVTSGKLNGRKPLI